MSRDLGTDNENASLAGIVRPAFFAEFKFGGGDVLVWTGVGEIIVAGLSRTFQGLGNFGNVAPVEEVADVSPRAMSFQLSGVPSAQIALALGEEYRGRVCRLWLGFFDDDLTTLLATPYEIFSGRMDTMLVRDAIDSASLAVNAESRLADLQRPRTRRYSDEEQQRLFAGDLGCAYVVRLGEVPIYFGSPGGSPAYAPGPGDVLRRFLQRSI